MSVEVNECRRALKHAPDNAELHARLGAALSKSLDHSGAFAAFRKAIRLEPHNERYLHQFTHCLSRQFFTAAGLNFSMICCVW